MISPPSPDEARDFCIEDFYKSLHEACREAGGRPLGLREDIRLTELADVLAQNGVRFIYDKSRAITSVVAKRVLSFKE